MDRLVRCWYGRCAVRFLLAPLSLLFYLVSGLRRLAYRQGWFRAERLQVPVVVVGNITVGGTGKTPVVIWLTEQLRQAGYRPGIVSRGHGGHHGLPRPVRPDGDPGDVGDEPVLLARRTACPVWVGRRRAKAAAELLAFHPEVDVIISDDGLQHYALTRDVEIAVVDGARGFGNGWLLPAGPLREPRRRLARVDALVVNGAGLEGLDLTGLGVTAFPMTLKGEQFQNLARPEESVAAGHFAGKTVQAIAGIGNPERFFMHLQSLGLSVVGHPFPDHHDYRPDDLPAGTVIMTEKDSVKCAAFGSTDAWVNRVDAEIDAGLKTKVLERIGYRHGP